MSIDINKLAEIYGPFVGQDPEAADVMALIGEIKQIVSENIAISENAINAVRKANRSLEIEIEHNAYLTARNAELVEAVRALLKVKCVPVMMQVGDDMMCPWCLRTSDGGELHYDNCPRQRAAALVGELDNQT